MPLIHSKKKSQNCEIKVAITFSYNLFHGRKKLNKKTIKRYRITSEMHESQSLFVTNQTFFLLQILRLKGNKVWIV